MTFDTSDLSLALIALFTWRMSSALRGIERWMAHRAAMDPEAKSKS